MLKSLLDKPFENLGKNAPIAEALIDIRVAYEKPPDREALRSVNESLERPYPKVKTQAQWAGQIRIEPEAEPTMTSHQALRGFLLLSEDEKEIVQVRRDGFTFSRLWPYDSWATVRGSARELWSKYATAVPEGRITRLAVRYINKIGFEQDPLVPSDWFKILPSAPTELGTMSEYAMQLRLTHPKDHRVQANITQGTHEPLRKNHRTAAVFDIDVWTITSMGLLDAAAWDMLDDLRTYKNDLFFGSLTQRAEEWINGGSAGPE